jgi:hypothetical protein
MIEDVIRNPVLGYLTTSLSAGCVLSVIRLVQEGRWRPPQEALLLLFLPAIGWGSWSYARRRRRGEVSTTPRWSLILGRMGWLHAIQLTVGFIAFAVVVSHLAQHAITAPMNEPSETNATGAAFVIATGVVAATVFSAGALLVIGMGFVAYVVLLLLFSVLPWIIAASIRSRHVRERMLTLEMEAFRARTNAMSNLPPLPPTG